MTIIFDTSKLYHLFLNNDGNECEIQNVFLNKVTDFGLTEEEIKIFLNDYKAISYDENNILKYIDIVSYFQYSIKENFIDYIIEHYVFDQMLLLDKLEHTNIITKIEKLCEEYKWKSNEQLLYISKYIVIKKLNLSCNKNITDEGIKNFINIHTLDLRHNDKITDEGTKHLLCKVIR